MKPPTEMPNRCLGLLAKVLTACLLTAAFSVANAQNTSNSAEDQIKAVIAKTYDQPGKKVETAPVVVVDSHALADWVQGDMGGRALLRLNNGLWEIMACGGDDFKKNGILSHAGISASTAKKLIAQLEKAEQSLPAARVKQFGLFGSPNDPRLKHHSAAHPAH